VSGWRFCWALLLNGAADRSRLEKRKQQCANRYERIPFLVRWVRRDVALEMEGS